MTERDTRRRFPTTSGGLVRRLSDVNDGHDYFAVKDVVQMGATPT